ncbi:MAG: hypothetical protein ACPGSI_16440 [Pikeienuella sp.]
MRKAAANALYWLAEVTLRWSDGWVDIAQWLERQARRLEGR